MVWKKQLSSDSVAILLMNNRNVSADVSVTWGHGSADFPTDLPLWQERESIRCSSSGCKVRDVHAHKDLGFYATGFTAKGLAPHDSAFIIVSSTVSQ